MKLICPKNFAHVGKSCGNKCTCFQQKINKSNQVIENEN